MSQRKPQSCICCQVFYLITCEALGSQDRYGKVRRVHQEHSSKRLDLGSSKLVLVGYGIKNLRYRVQQMIKLEQICCRSRSLLLRAMYSPWTWLLSIRPKIPHGALLLNKSLKDKKQNERKKSHIISEDGAWTSIFLKSFTASQLQSFKVQPKTT